MPDKIVGQQTESFNLKGIIIFPANDTLNRIVPQDVLLIPYEYSTEKSLAENVVDCINENNEPGYLIYTQAIRWTQPDVEKFLENMEFITLKLKSIEAPYLNPFGPDEIVCKVFCGEISFGTQKGALKNLTKDNKIYEAILSLAQAEKTIHYFECPKEFGAPRYFR